MIAKKDNLYLDHITYMDADGIMSTMPVASGLVIKVEMPKETLDLAYIYWDDFTKNCYIRTVEDRLQNYVVWYETYADFVYLVDEAYYKIGNQHLQKDN